MQCTHFLPSNLEAAQNGGYQKIVTPRLPAVLQSGGTHPSMLPMSETTYRHFDMQDILLSVGHTAVSEAKRQNQCGIAKVC